MKTKNRSNQLAPVRLFLLLALLGEIVALRAAPQDVVINELMYHPDAANTGGEYVELYNRGKSDVNLSGWVLDGAVEFLFPADTILLPGGYLIAASDAAAARAFYGISNVVGDFVGRLDNTGETVQLEDAASPRLLIDTVAYDDVPPWGPEADGGGASLELIIPDGDNSDPANWGVGQPNSPGRANSPRPADGGALVINEIMYSPTREEFRETFDAVNSNTYFEMGEDELGEYVELFNRSTTAVDLAGWALTEGIAYTFSNSVLAAGEYLLVAAWPDAARVRFGITNVVGPFTGALDNGGERVTLRDAGGGVVDTVRYHNHAPWPAAPDDFGYSLECIDPAQDNSTAANWRSSRSQLSQPPPGLLPPLAGFIGRGTPGRPNSVFSSNLPPFISDVRRSPEKPASTQHVLVTARVQSKSPLRLVMLHTTLDTHTNETVLAMFDDGAHGDGVANDSVFGVFVTAKPSGTLVHYQVVATADRGGTTTYPYPDDPAPTQAYFHYDGEIHTACTLFELFLSDANRAILEANPRSDNYVDGSIVIDQLAYPHVGMRYRGRRSRDDPKRSWQFQFNKTQLYKGNRTYDTMFSIPLEQAIAYEVFDSAGIDNLDHELVRLHINGSFWGVYVGFESPTGAWLDKHGHSPDGELYKARTVETPGEWKNSDLFRNQLVTDFDYWGSYNKKVRPLEPPTALRELVAALNDLPDAQLLPWLDAHVDLEQWFKRWALNVGMNIDDFCGHNYYLFLPGEPGGKWKMLGYDFDSGFTYSRVGPMRPLYADGGEGDNPAWQRNKLCQRVSANPTLRRIYLLTLRKMVHEVILLDRIFPRIDQLFALMTPDRTADLDRWSTMRPTTEEAKDILTQQRRALMEFLASAATGLPSQNSTPVISPSDGSLRPGGTISVFTQPGWQAYYTLDGSDPRLSLSRQPYKHPITVSTDSMFKTAAIPLNLALTSGDWTDLALRVLTIDPRPVLVIQHAGDKVRLTWPAQFTNHVVETAAAIPGIWTQLPVAPMVAGQEFHVEQNMSNYAGFFRLKGR